jgi:hypothetical protein
MFDAIILIALLVAIFNIRLDLRNYLIGFAAAASLVRLGESIGDLKRK